MTSTFWHVGAHFEVEGRSDGWTRMRSRVFFAGRPVYDHVDKFLGESGGLEEAYLHLDHQGSLDRVTPVTAELTGRTYASFDAFGKRRGQDWTTNNLDNLFNESDFTETGYTGHQHLDSVKMIHMNGRVQDPIWGRMLSPDPMVGDLTSPQSLNAYSYAWNNPATLTDPTGYGSDLCALTPMTCTSYYLVETSWEGRVESYSGGIKVSDTGWKDTSSTFKFFSVRDVSFDPGWGGFAGLGVSAPVLVLDPDVAVEVGADAARQGNQDGKCWNGSLGVGGAAAGPVAGPAGVGVSGGASLGFSYGGSLLDSRIFVQVQAAGMAGSGVYAGIGISGQGGPGAVSGGLNSTTSIHSELNVGAGLGGSIVVDTPLGSGSAAAGGYHGRFPGGRFGLAAGAAAGIGVGTQSTYGFPTMREILESLVITVDAPASSCAP